MVHIENELTSKDICFLQVGICRSVTMDKWKELELNKMKSGGNNQAKEFLEAQSDWKAGGNISANYNSKAAALYRDKVTEDLTKIPNNIFAFADIL